MTTKNLLTRLSLAVSTLFLVPTSTSGQVTIGSSVQPQATLDIIGDTAIVHGQAFRLIDGNESQGRVLTVGENGVATWRYTSLYRVVGVRPTSEIRFPLISSTSIQYHRQTGAHITLPPGKWEVRVHMLISLTDVSTNPPRQHNVTANDFAWMRTSFVEDPTSEGTSLVPSPDIVGGHFISGRVSGPLPTEIIRNAHGAVAGSIIIHNQSGTDKTYYFVAGGIDSASSFTETEVVVRLRGYGNESSIIATPILP